ncbi:GPI mannosyltransferase 2 [Venturia canescens]|uniref:GPI mannosyltransferase 2 n=1 Tax=Venturia canescens TaxID=32260 RepID=UPI001C9BCDBF|nr:GPI mannosyltransferase 2 [Venturia canescens]XP_043276960.1 GPI mannosyltransferase 2 [Venturia canescens]
MYNPRQKVLWFSIISRACVLTLQFIFNLVIPDHKADAFVSPLDPLEQVSIYDRAVDVCLGGLIRWDAQYFIHIAKYGYTFENTLAFFPLYPLCVRYLAMIMGKVFFMLNNHSIIVLAAVSLNYFCFVKSALILYDLSKHVLKSTNLAYKAAILYCMNPASIFFSAAYSESMFAYVTFYSMLGSLELLRFVYIPIGLSALVRSNGLVNIGFPIFMWLHQWLKYVLPKIILEYRNSVKKSFSVGAVHTMYDFLNTLNTIFLSLIPFVFFQIYVYLLFCTEYNLEVLIPPHVESFAVKNHLQIPSNNSFTWCQGTFPIAYSNIQKKYWNVGFMKYYEFKQIPNFLLASPILYIMLKCIYQYLVNWKEFLYYFLGMEGKESERIAKAGQLPVETFVFVIHALFLTIFSILFIHIQVSTRFLASASPLLYWYCATILSYRRNSSKEFEESCNLNSKWRVFLLLQESYTLSDRLIILYFLGYIVLGCAMYSNFLPWT